MLKLILNYLECSRIYISVHCYFFYFIALAVSVQQTGKVDYFLSLLCFGITFFNHNIAYLINSLIDFLYEVDTDLTVDKTLFGLTSIIVLKRYMWFSTISIGLLLIPVYTNYNFDIFKIVLYFTIIQYIGSVIYTPAKYVACGQFFFFGFHVSTLSFFYFSQCKEIVIFDMGHPITLFNFLIMLSMLQVIQGNYHRDHDDDKRAGIITIAILLGKKLSLYYFYSLFIMYCIWVIYISFYLNNFYYLLMLLIFKKMHNLYLGAKKGDVFMLNWRVCKIYYLSYPFLVLAIILGGKITI
ncbi:hypothetical protein DICPUDRAFT_81721 [Dictyostelium purpureum]|uniref:UbiA prenyltransferase family protein n=1 Tax=Dictyostelium purpureum TaxID=5786 RepID=F0ZUD7_DICPU|nr:uncharacterized protein DICPUDRAFT_81721 [Dictyostelium purpureum]EGC32449.1 hypothetical protein DICPUDRAFT_81721 [Dictyostelium purpureum]|eukprot:XP_003291021.1 hypothetical protein DICPUDRAFT_81721 [Dictyostelium purpureum]